MNAILVRTEKTKIVMKMSLHFENLFFWTTRTFRGSSIEVSGENLEEGL